MSAHQLPAIVSLPGTSRQVATFQTSKPDSQFVALSLPVCSVTARRCTVQRR